MESTLFNKEGTIKNNVDSTSQEPECSSKSQTQNEDEPEMRPSSTKEKNKDGKKFGLLLPILTISFVVFLTVLVIYFIDAPDRKEGNVFTLDIYDKISIQNALYLYIYYDTYF